MDKGKIIYHFNINSFDVKAEYKKRDIDDIFIPLAHQLDSMQKKAGNRLIVYVAGPGGAGKTTVSYLFEALIRANTNNSAQAIGIDGFHFNSEYLNSHYITRNGQTMPLRDIKGSAESYDYDKLHGKIVALKQGDIYWPYYDRCIHDVIDDHIFVEANILIIEGNWLMLDEPRWRDLARFCDYSVFVYTSKKTLISRLTDRKRKGGLGKEEAEQFVMRSDAANIDRILSNRLCCDLVLEMKENGEYVSCLERNLH